MNQVHKVIWSRVKNCYIVVSEITKRVGRDNKASVTGIRPLRALLCAMVIAGCMLPADADAAPGLIHAGTGATASGDSSIAYGYSAQAKKDHSIAQGTGADAEEEYALAMGYKATAKGLQSLAIGRQANAIGNNSIAAGAGAKGYAQDGVAIGNNAESGTADDKDPRIPTILSKNGVAVGNSAKASGGSSVSVGNDSIGNGPSSVAIGNAATANDVRTTAIGNNAHAEGAGSLSIGREASALTLENATSTNPLVTGTDEQLDKKGVMAIGDNAMASGNNSIALGTSAKAGDLEKKRNEDSVSLTGDVKRITKLTTKRSVNNAVAVGTESSVQSDEDIAVGYRAATVKSKYHQLPGSGQVAIGSNSNTYGTRGDVAIGSGAETNIRVKNVDHTAGTVEKPDGQSVAIGSVAKAYGSQAVAVGADTRAIGNSSVAIGTDDIELDRTRLESLLPGLEDNENLNNKAPNDATLGSAALGDKPCYVKTASIGTASVAIGAMSQAAGDASMAMGLNALAEGDASTAIGPLARSKGKNSIAMGRTALAKEEGAVAVGNESLADGTSGTALGNKAKAKKNYDIAVGYNAAAEGNPTAPGLTDGSALSIGTNANAKGTNAVSIGNNAQATNTSTVAVGGTASGYSATSLGYVATAGGTSSVALGYYAQAAGSYGTAVGGSAKAKGESSIAVGAGAEAAGGKGNTAIGHKAKVESTAGDGNIAFGSSASVKDGAGHIVIGKNASANTVNGYGIAIGSSASIGIGAAADAAAIGTGSRVEGSGIAFGRQAQVTASSTESGIAIGTESSVDGAQKGTAIGYKAKVLSSGDDSGLAIGTESSAGGNEGSIALGKKASVDSSTNAGGVAIGLNASAKGISSIVIGKDAKADDGNQAHVIAIGVGATATGTSQYSSVMGSAAKASREYSTVLGSNANSEVDGGVALGANSISNRHAGGSATGDVRTTNPYIPAGAGAAQVNAINATKGTTGAVSVGSDTVKRQIINVAAGTDDSDAVNVAQLKAAAANAAGSVSWTVQENYRDVNEVKNGSKVNFADGANTTASVKKDASGKVTAVKYDLKKDVNLGADGSLTINGKTYVNKDGLNANSQKITNVADGTVNSDAVNFGQLKDAVAAGKTILKDGKNTTVEGEGTVANPYKVNVNDDLVLGKKGADGKDGSIGVNGKDGSAVVINGKDGSIGLNGKDGANGLTIKGGDGKPGVDGTNITRLIIEEKDGKKHDVATLDDGMKYGGDTGAVIKKKLNEQVNVVGGITDESKLTTDDNIGVVSDGSNNLKVRLAKNINLGPDGSLTINGKTYVNKDGLNANGQKITNVANGTVNSDAVNFGQLKDAVAAGKTILKDGKNTTVEGEGTVANPYKVNVNDDLVLGKKGADGKDGSIGVNGKDGSSVVIHGKDGISIKGKDGKDGVTLKAKDGANGTEGQIGLTGPAGKDGKSTHADIGVNAGPASLDPAKNLSATEMTRLYYVDEKGDHQVATMDDGMKFAGNTGLAIKKLNSTMTIRGTGTKADTEYDPSNIKTMVDADGNMIVGLDKNLKADSVGINGKDGRDGATIKGGDGKPGVDGTNITRLIIEEKNGKQHDIATLDDGMKYGGDTGAVIKKKLNEQVNVVGGITDESKLTTDDNIGVVSDGSNNLKVRLAKDVKLNSVTAGNVVMDTTGFYVKKMTRTPAGTVSLTADGLNNGGNKIANIAAGEADTDAVNVSQLKNQGSEIVNKGFGIKAEDGNEVKKKLGETVDVVGDGKNISTRVEGGRVRVGLKDDILLNSVTTGRTRMDTNGLTVQDGSGNTAVTVDKDGLKIKDGPSVTKSGIDAGGKKITNVAAGEADTDAVNVSQLKKAAAGATTKVADGKNTTVTSETNADGSKTYHVNLNDDITLGTDPSKQISIKGTEGTIKAGQVTVNGTAGTVNGLTNKTWDPNNITSGQAATEDQLKVVSGQAGKHSSVTAGSNISVTTGTNANGGTEYKVAVVDTPTFKTVTTGNTVMSNSGLTIKNGPSITQTGVDAGGKRITNVAAGKADTDAVNVGQLKQIGGAINKVDNRINRVGAGAAALAALHPLDFDPDDKWDFTLGYGNYKDAHSLALGAFYRPNEDTMISVGGSIGGGENMVNAGLSMKLGQGNHVSTSKVAMAKEIKDLRAELENVKGALLKVADGRPLDSMDMDKMQLFPDVPENHWAYDYVATLAGNGVIVGYPDGQFGGDRMMTRYEMAALIYRAMQNGAAADDRMARALKEFEPELERIRVDTISKHKDGTPDIQRVRVIKGRG